jgi:SAM-dependent methyltransferase
MKIQRSSFNNILENISRYYSEKIKLYGATPRGVDWNSRESQELRFEQLLKICESKTNFLINDYGCGYCALIEYLIRKKYTFQYKGYDLSKHMIAKATELYKDLDFCQFFADETKLTEADYTVASGIFNVKQQISDEVWIDYIWQVLEKISKLSKRGFAFNMLTSYSNKHRMRKDLYYAEPTFIFDYCKRRFSSFVSLLHDYPLYEFTILVKK